MPDYKKMYLHLFNAVTDSLAIMCRDSCAAELLRTAQRECEEMYVSEATDEIKKSTSKGCKWY